MTEENRTIDSLLYPDRCTECNGAGMITMAMGAVMCPRCKGTGKKPTAGHSEANESSGTPKSDQQNGG